jgi:ornithine carbamoyltransferase
VGKNTLPLQTEYTQVRIYTRIYRYYSEETNQIKKCMLNTDNCIICGSEFIKKTTTQTTCPDKNCRKQAQGNRKITRHKEWKVIQIAENAKTARKEQTLAYTVKKAMMDEMDRQVGYQHCQQCNRSNIPLEIHHIAFRSETRWHPQKHSRRNSIIVCRDCHKWFHDRKENRDEIIRERKLYEVFTFLHKEYYEKN